MRESTKHLDAGLRGRYRVRHKIGEGGMADVYLALDEKHDRLVALKVLKPEIASALGVERFLAEINTAASLAHPHVLPVHDSGQVGGSPYYVMPYIEGQSLREHLKREGQLPIAEVANVTHGVAEALAYAHSHGIVHRDIKPGNILMGDGVPLVTDFGVALAVSESEQHRLTQTGMAIGTPSYMSPEQAAGERDIDARSDQYSLACVVYEMLTGEPPLNGPTNQVILARRLVETPLSIRTVRSAVPVGLERAVMKALARAPADRYASVEEFSDHVRETALETAGAPGQRIRSRTSGSRLLRRVATGAAIALALALGVAWLGPRFGTEATVAPDSRLAVFPFEVSGGVDQRYLSEAVASLLGTALDGVGGITTVDSRALLIRVETEGLTPFDIEHERRIAESFQAGRHIVGRIANVGSSVRLDAVLRGASTSDTVSATVEGEISELAALTERLAIQLLTRGQLVGDLSSSEVRVRLGTELDADPRTTLLTSSLEALRAFLEGDQLLRQGRMNDAAVAYQSAVDIDDEFALAFHRLSFAAWGAQRYDLVTPAAGRAIELLDQLSDQDARLVTAFAAYRRGDARQARQGYGRLVDEYPNNVEAWLMLAETVYHFGPLTGQPSGAARQPFERTLSLDPNQRTALGHLAGVAAMERSLTEADSLVRVYLDLYPDADLALWMHMLRAVSLDDPASIAIIEARLAGGEATPLDLMFAAAFYGDFEWARRLSLDATSPARTVQERLGGHGLGAFIDMAIGRRARALDRIAQLEMLVPGLALTTILESHLALTPLAQQPRGGLEDIARRLESLTPGSADEVLQIAYQVGSLAAMLGDHEAALDQASMIRALPDSVHEGRQLDLALGVEAQALLARGEVAEALATLQDVSFQAREELSFNDPNASLVRERYLMGELLRENGRPQDALAWYASIADGIIPVNPVFESIYLPAARVRQGDILFALGRTQEAATQYAAFLTLWSGGDQGLQQEVERVRNVLETIP